MLNSYSHATQTQLQSFHSDEDLGGLKKHKHRPNIGLREKVQTFRLHSLASAVCSPPPGEHMDAMICHEAFRKPWLRKMFVGS